MLQIDWKLVYAKAEEWYPRYKKGLPYSQLEAELQQQGLDKTHIDYINEELVKMLLEEKQRQLNWPLAFLATGFAVALVVGLVLLMSSGHILIGAGALIFLFIVLKMLFRRKHVRHSALRQRTEKQE